MVNSEINYLERIINLRKTHSSIVLNSDRISHIIREKHDINFMSRSSQILSGMTTQSCYYSHKLVYLVHMQDDISVTSLRHQHDATVITVRYLYRH